MVRGVVQRLNNFHSVLLTVFLNEFDNGVTTLTEGAEDFVSTTRWCFDLCHTALIKMQSLSKILLH